MKMMTESVIPHRCLQMAGLGVADSMMQLFGVELLRAEQHPQHRSTRNIYQWVQLSLGCTKFLGQSNSELDIRLTLL
jgi:hypothetical protein